MTGEHTTPAILPTADGRAAWCFLWERLRTRRWTTVLALLVALGASGCAVLPPLMVGRMVDRLSVPNADITAVSIPLGVMTLSIVLNAALVWLSRILFAQIAEPTVSELREDAVQHALSLDAGILEEVGPGELVSRVSDDSRLISTAVADILPTVLSAGTLLLISLPGLFGLHWALGLAGLGGHPHVRHGVAVVPAPQWPALPGGTGDSRTTDLRIPRCGQRS
jgi:ATP-binding cassette subfamily C protein